VACRLRAEVKSREKEQDAERITQILRAAFVRDDSDRCKPLVSLIFIELK
jgi:hypothetical protein